MRLLERYEARIWQRYGPDGSVLKRPVLTRLGRALWPLLFIRKAIGEAWQAMVASRAAVRKAPDVNVREPSAEVQAALTSGLKRNPALGSLSAWEERLHNAKDPSVIRLIEQQISRLRSEAGLPPENAERDSEIES